MALRVLLLSSTCALGVFLGAQLAEAVLIVPYWKGLSADSFFIFFKNYGQSLYEFYAPLTIAATIFPTVTFVYSLLVKSKTDILMWLLLVFTILFFAMYFIYFKDANLSFAQRTISDQALSNELVKWGNLHWTRVFCEAVAFVCGLLLLFKSK